MPRVPAVHAAFLTTLTQAVEADQRFLGLAIGGSYAVDEMDEFSDLDCILVLRPDVYAVPFADGPDFSASLGTLIASFDGRHVGEPRLLVCLFDNPLLHVDLKFVDVDGLARDRWEDPVVVFERAGELTAALQRTPLTDHSVDVQWIEDRFWVWVHYEATKIARGELLEAHASAAWFARIVLGPMVYANHGRRSDGVRRLEQRSPRLADALASTLACEHSPEAYLGSLRERTALYLKLREPFVARIELRSAAQAAALTYLAHIRHLLESR